MKPYLIWEVQPKVQTVVMDLQRFRTNEGNPSCSCENGTCHMLYEIKSRPAKMGCSWTGLKVKNAFPTKGCPLWGATELQPEDQRPLNNQIIERMIGGVKFKMKFSDIKKIVKAYNSGHACGRESTRKADIVALRGAIANELSGPGDKKALMRVEKLIMQLLDRT